MADVGEIRARLVLSSDQFTRGMQQARGQMDQTNRSAQRTSQAIDKIHKASLGFATAVGAVFAASIGTAANFEQKMKDVQAVSGESADNMQKLTDLAMEMGKKTAFSSAEAAQGIEELVKAGVSVTDILNGGLEGALNLAIAGNLDLADAAEIASTALNAFKEDNLSVAQAADILAGAANASATDVGELKYGLSMVSAVAAGAGLSFKDTTTALASFAQAGLKGSDAGTSLKTLILNLQPTTKKTGELFKLLGLETKKTGNAFYDAQGHIKSLADISQILHDKFKNLTDGERQAAFKQAFGTDAIRAANILYKEGAKGIDDMWAAMSKVKAADVAKVKLDSLKGSFTEFTSALESVGISIGMDFLPALTDITRKATDFVGSMDDVQVANVEGALAFAGTAAAVALFATSVIKVVSALRVLSASPIGLAITAVSLLAGVVMGAVVQQNKMNEVSLKNADSMLKQADSLDANIKQFDQLKFKTKLTTDEFGRFLDINSEIKKTADPNVIARLKDEQEKLRQKSGLSNDELDRMVQLNGDLVKILPQSTDKITIQGNAVITSTDQLKAYNQQQYERVRLELEAQKAKAEANMDDNLRKEEETLKRINGLKVTYNGYDQKEIDQRRKIKGLYDDLATAKTNNDSLEIDRLNQTIAMEENKLTAIKKQRAETAGKLVDQTKELDKIQTQLGKLDEVKRKMVDLELRQSGINAKRGEEIRTIDSAIGKLQQQKAELEKSIPVNQRNTAEYREARDAIQEQINKLQGTKSKVEEIIGRAAAMNDALGKDINKTVTVRTYQQVIASNDYNNSKANALKYHTGGIVGNPPKLHTGGPAWSVAPNHNEVDARLLRNEMVLTEAQQSNLMRMIDAGRTGGNNGALTSGEISDLKSLLGVIAQNTAQVAPVVVDGNALWNYVDTKQASQTRMNNRNGGIKR
jgi:TP901 family phage tail tape measure protein